MLSLHSGREISEMWRFESLLSIRLLSAITSWEAEPADFNDVQATAESYNLNGFKFGPVCWRV